jgi:hypothetical protein
MRYYAVYCCMPVLLPTYGSSFFRFLTVFSMLLLLLYGPAVSLHAQESTRSNLRSAEFYYQAEPQRIDSLSVLFLYAIILQDTLWDANAYFKVQNDSLFFYEEYQVAFPQTPLRLTYRRMPFSLTSTFQRLDPSIVQPDIDMSYIGFTYNTQSGRDQALNFGDLNYSGSFSRGISVGNRQSLVLNSSLNLQLNGVIGDDIELLAAISDNNIPIQPEGNTQQLQEFDRIFIELRKGSSMLRAGDFEVVRPQTYFLNYFKRSQGVLLGHEQRIGKSAIWTSDGSFAISKGKFRRQFIAPVEGNQGPYRLTGNDGETFIIVLANTERVYVDGELLKRGLELDYVIDYNRGELLFTTRKLITKELRIIIEFEYTDQQYLRSMYTANTALKSEKWEAYFNVFSEQDNKNSPGNQLLSDEDRLLLSQIGDRINEAVVSSIRIPDDDQIGGNPIWYVLTDTVLMDGRTFSGILRYTTEAHTNRRVATFTDFGEGNGNYIISANLANGRVFEWVAPDPQTGRPRGRFEPQARIVTPKLQRMMTVGGSWKPDDQQRISGELAYSTQDINRFSPIDAQNNDGFAAFLSYEGQFKLDSSGRFQIKPFANYENKSTYFRPINPYRNQEFNRDWNLQQDTALQEQIIQAGFRAQLTEQHQMMYQLSGFIQESNYTGFRHQYDISSRHKSTRLRIFGSELRSSSAEVDNRFSRPRIDLRQNIGQFELGGYAERERSMRLNPLDNTLLPGSFSWDIGRVSIATNPERILSFNGSFTARADQFPIDGLFVTATTAREWRMEGIWKQGKTGRLIWNVTGRELQVSDTSAFDFTPLQTYLGRVSYSKTAWKNVLRYNTTYEIGSGQEPRLEFVYLEVRPGEGQYIWTDRNGDGVQQLDEFEIAPFADQANFVRVATLTNDFVRTNNILFNHQVNLEPRLLWSNAKGWKKAVGKFSIQSNFNLNRKTLSNADVAYWNPLLWDFEQEGLVNGAMLSRQSFFFNRANPLYEIQFNTVRQRNRILLTTGFEKRGSGEDQINIRYNPGRRLSIQNLISLLNKNSEAEAFTTRDFNIDGWEGKQEYNFQIKQGVRIAGRWRYNFQQNNAGDKSEKATISEAGFQAIVNQSARFSIRADASFARVAFDGETNSAVEFAMLEGLRNGNNVLWGLQLERTMINNVQLQVSYEGRKTGENSTVHLGRMQLKATF